MAKALLEDGVDVNLPDTVNLQDKDGYTALHYAIRWNFLEMVNYLLANGADVGQRNNAGESSFDMAKKYSKFTILPVLEAFAQKKEAA